MDLIYLGKPKATLFHIVKMVNCADDAMMCAAKLHTSMEKHHFIRGAKSIRYLLYRNCSNACIDF